MHHKHRKTKTVSNHKEREPFRYIVLLYVWKLALKYPSITTLFTRKCKFVLCRYERMRQQRLIVSRCILIFSIDYLPDQLYRLSLPISFTNTSYSGLIIVSSLLIRSQTIALYCALFSLPQNIFNFKITSRTSPSKHFSSFDRRIPGQLNLSCLIRTNNKRQPTINSPCLNILAEDDTYRAGYLTRSGILPFTLHPRPQSNDRNSNNTSC